MNTPQAWAYLGLAVAAMAFWCVAKGMSLVSDWYRSRTQFWFVVDDPYFDSDMIRWLNDNVGPESWRTPSVISTNRDGFALCIKGKANAALFKLMYSERLI